MVLHGVMSDSELFLQIDKLQKGLDRLNGRVTYLNQPLINLTQQLPPIGEVLGLRWMFKIGPNATQGNQITINASAGETIDGASSIVLNTIGATLVIRALPDGWLSIW